MPVVLMRYPVSEPQKTMGTLYLSCVSTNTEDTMAGRGVEGMKLTPTILKGVVNELLINIPITMPTSVPTKSVELEGWKARLV
jgi:hypothetical protein